MKEWTTPAQVKEKIQKDWSRGSLLASAWKGQGLPHRVVLHGPTSAQWSDRFEEARRWIALWEDFPVEWREFNHPILGRNKVPVAVVYTDWNDLWRLIGQKAAARQFLEDARAIVGTFPVLEAWVADHPLAVVERADDWPRLLAIVDWIRQHPRPGVYLRQMDVPGVHTKFVDGHRSLLATLLDQVLASEAVDGRWPPPAFAERYGFLAKPKLVRFRFLDPAHEGPRDLAWRLDDWAQWPATGIKKVFITENEVNFLAFPNVAKALVVFGAGYGFDGWDKVPWLARAEVDYWGDLDTHGFAILDQLRARLPQVRSFLMDQATVLSHRDLWGREPQPTDRVLTRLTEDEQDVYQGLVGHRWASQLRLEQEQVPFSWVRKALIPILGPEE